LRSLLNTSGYNKDSILVGPEVNHIGDSKNQRQGEDYAKDFLNMDEDCIDYVRGTNIISKEEKLKSRISRTRKFSTFSRSKLNPCRMSLMVQGR